MTPDLFSFAEIMEEQQSDGSGRTSASSSPIRQHAGAVCGVL